MKKSLVGVLVVLTTVFSFQSNAQSVEEIITKHEIAMGGKDKWAALKSVILKSKFSVQGMDIQSTASILVGKAVKTEVEVMGNKIITSYDGAKGWMIRPAMMGGTGEPEDMPADQLEGMKSQTFPGSPLLTSVTMGEKIELESKEKLDGAEVYVLTATDKAGKVTNLYVSTSTYYVVKTSGKQNVNGKEIDIETGFSNYKKVDDLYFPFTIEQPNPMMGATMTIEVVDVNLKANLDASSFARPAKK